MFSELLVYLKTDQCSFDEQCSIFNRPKLCEAGSLEYNRHAGTLSHWVGRHSSNVFAFLFPPASAAMTSGFASHSHHLRGEHSAFACAVLCLGCHYPWLGRSWSLEVGVRVVGLYREPGERGSSTKFGLLTVDYPQQIRP